MARITGLVLVLLGWITGAVPAPALADEMQDRVQALSQGSYDDKEAAIGALAASGDPAIEPILRAMGDGDLYARESDGRVVIAKGSGQSLSLTDPLTGESLGEAAKGDLDKIRVNNRLRRAIQAALSGLTILSKDAGVRANAARTMLRSGTADALPALDQAIAGETDDGLRQLLDAARGAILLRDPGADETMRVAAVDAVSNLGDRDALSLLAGVAGGEGPVAVAATEALAGIQRQLAIWDAGQNITYGISLGSVLLLAAIGLAITFGVMGVINMAHGEMVMLGAYTTFVVQEAIRTHAPGLFDLSLFIAIPLAFLVAGAVGIAIERGIIRWLYGRPLETLLATWGVSLMLQQAVRSIFGPTNREVGNPSWMSGSIELGHLTLTLNRLWIILFSLMVFAGLMTLLKRTSFGLYMRAVTQNRPMAASMGIHTSRVDALTFGLGSGVAGLAGVALSQIDNVSPNLGQGYIIDSFMVVVFGGVGNLWGTLTGAFTLGIVNKFLEPYAGAVLGKILVLVFIILFIQKRPRGLFALKGRAVEV